MDYRDEIRNAATDPQRLEELYRRARSVREAESFRTAMEACYQQSPQNLLYAAWQYRLASEAAEERAPPPPQTGSWPSP